MSDRDTFAAAALTGLLAAPTDKDRSSEYWARYSYAIADAMLRERGDTPASYKKNDEKRGCTPTKREGEIDRLRSRVWETPRTPPPHATPSQGSKHGEGSVPDSRIWNEPVAWAVMERDGFGVEGTFTDRDEACEWCHRRQQIIPLYRHPHQTLTDAEREAIAWCADRWHTPQHTAATLRGLLERTN